MAKGKAWGCLSRLLLWSLIVVVPIAVVIALFRYEDRYPANSTNNPADDLMDWLRGAAWTFGIIVVVIAVLVWIVRAGVRGGVRDAASQSRVYDGPGLFRIDGVDRQKRTDMTVRIRASSAANARAKAELDGIVVTSVVRESN